MLGYAGYAKSRLMPTRMLLVHVINPYSELLAVSLL